jgi:hypothetical protein
MATFVHLTPEKYVRSIERTGIKAGPTWLSPPDGVYAVPVVPDFSVSHQWLRELKRGGQRTICGVYFRIPDEEQVWVGHYGRNHLRASAAEAVRLMMNAGDAQGYEVIIPRKIDRDEILSVRHLPQVVGWRYKPGAHGTTLCGCPVCVRPGEIKRRRTRVVVAYFSRPDDSGAT